MLRHAEVSPDCLKSVAMIRRRDSVDRRRRPRPPADTLAVGATWVEGGALFRVERAAVGSSAANALRL